MWTALSQQVHQDNVKKGFWPDGVESRNVGELLALVHSEISEAYTAGLVEANDDKLTHLNGFDVEIADAVIRLLDAGAAYGIPLDDLPVENSPYISPYSSVTDDLMEAHTYVSDALEAHRKANKALFSLTVTQALWCLIGIYEKWQKSGLSMRQVVDEKLAYNRSRPFMHGKKY